MIPKKLTLQGLYSYQDRQIIDFEKLMEGQIFGIFGAVGSGKSSILEAMAFAIYSETERLNTRGDDRAYNMMNLNSKLLYVDFEFVAGKEQSRFRCIVEGKRNGKRFEKVTLESSYFEWVKEEWIPTPQGSIISTLGLSYEHFRRTVIIPQGKFQEFLQLGNADRTKMLKELFGLEKYDLWSKTNALDLANNLEIENLLGKLSTSEHISKDLIEEQKAKLTLIEKEKDLLVLELQTVEADFQLQEKLKSIHEKFTIAKDQLSTLEISKATYDARKAALEQHLFYERNFKPFLTNLNRLNSESKQHNQHLSDHRTKTIQAEQTLAQLIEKITPLTKKLEAKGDWLKEVEDLKLLSELIQQDKDITHVTDRLQQAAEYFETQETKEKELQAQINLTTQQIDLLSSQILDTQDLLTLQNWDRSKKEISKQKEQLDKKITAEKQKVEQTCVTLSALINETAPNPPNFNSYREQSELKTKQLENGLLQLEKEKSELGLQLKLSAHRKDLKEGDACPLCGAVEHTIANHDDSEFLTQFEKAENNILADKQLLKVEDDFCSSINQIEHDFTQSQNLISELKKEYNNFIQEEEKTILPLELQQRIDLKSTGLQDLFNAQNALENNQKELIRAREESQEKLQGLQVEKNKAIAGKSHYESQKETLTSRFSSQVKMLQHHEFSDYKASGQNPTVQREAIEKNIQTLEADLQRLDKEKIQVQQEMSGFSSAQKLIEQQLSLITIELEKENSNFDNKLSETATTRDEVERVLNNSLDISAEKNTIDLFFDNYKRVATEVRILKEQLGNQAFNTASYSAIVEKYQTLKKQVGELQNKVGVEQTTLNAQLLEWEKKQTSLLKKEQLEQRKQSLSELKKLFKASGFVNYVSSVYLQNLCRAANARFYPLSKQSLKLEINNANQFVIRDYLNNGEVRSVKTLSGGQTFQVSLCLALALADSINKQQEQKENFFFLDEGFGTLDKESLQAVIKTLKALRKENRKVGLISHVEELQEEIDHYLVIENKDEKGSIVQASWN